MLQQNKCICYNTHVNNVKVPGITWKDKSVFTDVLYHTVQTFKGLEIIRIVNLFKEEEEIYVNTC